MTDGHASAEVEGSIYYGVKDFINLLTILRHEAYWNTGTMEYLLGM